MRMPPGATDVVVREDYELRDGAAPSALERCAISADMDGIKALPRSHSIRAYLAVLYGL
jgi:hypothetical protein